MKTVLITGATDGIGLEAAKLLAADGHKILLHGRSAPKIEAAEKAVTALTASVDTISADFSRLDDVAAMARAVMDRGVKIDVLINNAGVLKAPADKTADGFDIRFVVNTFAPYLLTKGLMGAFTPATRIVNLSSAAQASVDLAALAGETPLEPMEAYSQSKLALMMWTVRMAADLPSEGPTVFSVNPGSLLASKMVKEGFGIAGNDLSIGARILREASVNSEFAGVSGRYFDNDSGAFGPGHPELANSAKVAEVVAAIDGIIRRYQAAG